MGYFQQIMSDPAARLSIDQLVKANVIGGQAFGGFFNQLGGGEWRTEPGGSGEDGNPIFFDTPNSDALSRAAGYTFGWQDTGPENTGTLTAYDPTGKLYGQYTQQDQSFGDALGEWAMLAGAGFGGLGLAGFGPAASLFGGAGAGGASGGFSAGAVDSAALGLDGAFGATAGAEAGLGAGTITGGGGLTAGGSAGYGTIAGGAGVTPGALGAGGGSFAGAGLTAPAFVGGGSGLAGGLGTVAGVGSTVGGSGGISSLLGGLGSLLPGGAGGLGSLASIASGLYGMKLAGDARQASDPFAPYRAGYAQKLMALEANPGSIVTRPGFEAGIEAIKRKSGAAGYAGSGNLISALGRYSGDFYNQEATRLAGLAGAGQTPGAGQALGADLASQSLGSIGYGLGPLLQRLAQGG